MTSIVILQLFGILFPWRAFYLFLSFTFFATGSTDPVASSFRIMKISKNC